MKNKNPLLLTFLLSIGMSTLWAQATQSKVLVQGKLWAVVIGISEYENQDKFAKLPAAQNDARQLYSFLVDPLGGGMDKRQIQHLPNATMEELWAARTWLRRNVKEQDRVLFFYAGHGEIDRHKKVYLVPKNGNAFYDNPNENELASSVIGMELQGLKEYLWGLPAQQVAMVLDCCYSGTVVESKGSRLRAGVRRRKKNIDLGDPIVAKPSSEKQEMTLEEGKQRIVITSCQAGEKAMELASFQQGAFTHYLLRGIWGLADSDGDKRVDIKEAFEYLQEEVQELAREHDHKQTPQIKIWGEAPTPYYLKLEEKDRPLVIQITEPAQLQEQEYLVVSLLELRVLGKVRFGPGVQEIYVDQKKARWQRKGQEVVFEAEVALRPGKMKPFRIKVVDLHGTEHEHDVMVYSTYQPQPKSHLPQKPQQKPQETIVEKEKDSPPKTPSTKKPKKVAEKKLVEKEKDSLPKTPSTKKPKKVAEKKHDLPLADKNFPGFTFLRTQRYSVGGQSHEVKEYRHNKTAMEFVLLPGGNFEIRRGKRRRIKVVGQEEVKPFLMAKYEVTQGVWYQVMGSKPWQREDNVKEGENYPATYISWQEAKEFCEKTGLRLPSEVEWEYGYCSGTKSQYYWGEKMDQEYAWYYNNAYRSRKAQERYARQVGQKRPNAYGLYDMAGNVWEWCAGSPIRRGGGWDSNSYRCSHSYGKELPENYRNDNLGFRCVVSIP